MGWEPAQITTFEYDGDRLVRAVTVVEPEWSAEDRALLVASRRAERVKRGPHGYSLEEAMDPANQFRFDPGKPRRDFAMKALQDAQRAYFKANPDARDDRSLVWDVKKR